MGGITTTINKVKYIGIASLTIAILSILILNLISTYSSSNIESNAEPVAQANSTLVSGPAEISLSISSSPSSTGGNDANLSLQIPRKGGIATGRHTVGVSSNNYTGYSVKMRLDSDTYNLTNKDSPDDNTYIEAIGDPSTLTNPMYLQNSQWGIAFPGSTGLGGTMGSFYGFDYSQTITNPSLAQSRPYGMVPRVGDTSYDDEIMSSNTSTSNDTQNIYYAVRVDNPVELPAGDYSTNIILTATTHPVETPTITSVTPNTYKLGSGADSTATITGTNLASTYRVYLKNTTDGSKQYDVTNSITNVTDGQLTVTLPTDKTNPELGVGDYTIHVVTQGGEDSIEFAYTEKQLPDGMLESTDDYGDDGHVAVDYDENLIPIKITTNSYGSPIITALPKNEIDNNPSVWYDYSAEKKQWANAVTVKNPEDYKNITSETTITDSDILGYWVYIPRYAYKVMRRDASDRAVSDTAASRNGGFEIKFETASDPKKTPVKCSRTGQDYQTCVGASALEYPTDPANKDKTAWATHPAFSWGTDADGYEEMNGFWIGKFETTEPQDKQTSGFFVPTILPNAVPLGAPGYDSYDVPYWSSLGDLYNTGKMFGVEDKDNIYGGAGSGDVSSNFRQNNHNLSISTSHVVKNSEWGAIIYLSSSKFGIGMEYTIRPNLYVDSNYTTRTGCSEDAGSSHNCTFTSSDTMLTSTTGTEYGVYDMVGGAWELAMGAYGRNNIPSITDGFTQVPRPPYAQVYNMTNSASCTWETCGGDATYEVSTSTIYPMGAGGSVASSQAYSMWGSAYGSFVSMTSSGTNPAGPWFTRGLGADIITSGMATSPQSNSQIYTYGIWATPNEALSEGAFALRVVLRNSMDGEVSGGDEGGGDEEEEQPSRITVYNVVPPSAEAYFETEYQMSGTNLQLVDKLVLTSSNGAQWECQIGSHTNTHIKCTAMTISFQPGPITAMFYDSNGSLLLKMENFSTITANDWS